MPAGSDSGLAVAGARGQHRLRATPGRTAHPAAEDAPIPFHVLIDDQPPGPSHGTDADGNGMLDAGRLYQLIREVGEVRERVFEITFDAPGAQAYAFTFG